MPGDVPRWRTQLTVEHTVDLTASGESEPLEFQETTGGSREAAMTMSAFLNQSGGQVLFGVKDDGSVVGQCVREPHTPKVLTDRRVGMGVSDRYRSKCLVLVVAGAYSDPIRGYYNQCSAPHRLGVLFDQFAHGIDFFGDPHIAEPNDARTGQPSEKNQLAEVLVFCQDDTIFFICKREKDFIWCPGVDIRGRYDIVPLLKQRRLHDARRRAHVE